MPDVHANGIDIHYEITGRGEPLVLIAGSGVAALEAVLALEALAGAALGEHRRRAQPGVAGEQTKQLAGDAAGAAEGEGGEGGGVRRPPGARAAGCSGPPGSQSVKRAPPPGASPARTAPACRDTTWCTIARPRPEPGIERDSRDR